VRTLSGPFTMGDDSAQQDAGTGRLSELMSELSSVGSVERNTGLKEGHTKKCAENIPSKRHNCVVHRIKAELRLQARRTLTHRADFQITPTKETTQQSSPGGSRPQDCGGGFQLRQH